MRILLLSLTILACWAAEAEAIKLPADVQAAIDKAEDAERAVRSKADTEIVKIKTGLIKELTKAQEAVTKKGDLNLALAIKERIDSVELPEIIDTRRINAAKFKSYTAKAWDTFPGTAVTVNAEAYTTVATLEKNQEAILLPHPGDQWASHDKASKIDYRGLPTQHRGFPEMCLVVKHGNEEEQPIVTTKAYAGPGFVILSANQNTMSNNVGSIRVKVIIQEKR